MELLNFSTASSVRLPFIISMVAVSPSAENVKISITRICGKICVSVEDDGIGFNPSEVASNAGFGIFSIRERLEQRAERLENEQKKASKNEVASN